MSPATTRERLKVVASFGTHGCTPAEFAGKAYADSKEWKKPVPRGGMRGGKVIRAAAGVLGRLRAGKLVERQDGRFRITQVGKEYVSAKPQAQPPVAARPPAKAQPAPPQWVQAPGVPGGWLWWDGTSFWCRDAVGRLFFWGKPASPTVPPGHGAMGPRWVPQRTR